MSKKPRLGRDPFKDEGPLSFIGDTRGGPGRSLNTRGFIIGPERVRELPGRKRGNIGNTDNISNTGNGPGAKRGRPKGSGAKGPGDWKRATFIMRIDTLEKIKALAFWERATVTELIDRALAAYLKGKTIKPIGSK